MSKTTTKKKNYQIPFLPDGSVPHYYGGYGQQNGVEWKDPEFTFDGVLVFEGYSRGRSAAYFNFRNRDTGAQYSMFLTDMEDILKHRIIALGMIGGRWGFVKRGGNYGIQFRA
jgi:hypothetical protein